MRDKKSKEQIQRLPLTAALTLLALFLLSLGPFEAELNSLRSSNGFMLFGPMTVIDDLKGSFDLKPLFDEFPNKEDGSASEVKPKATKILPPPGLDEEFLRLLANECPAVDYSELREIVLSTWKICQQEGYHFLRALAQMRAESDFNPSLVSSAGARGVMQIIPRTADFMGFEDIDSLEANIRCGIRYMLWLDRFTDHSGARERWIAKLASYNSGPGRYTEMLERTRRRYDKENWSYVAKTYRRRFRCAPGRSLPETLIYIRRNLDTLERFHEKLFSSSSFAQRDFTKLVRIPLTSSLEATAVD